MSNTTVTALLPNTAITTTDLPYGGNDGGAALTADVAIDATSFPVAELAHYTVPCIVRFGQERILFTGKSASSGAGNLTTSAPYRGYDGSAAAAHKQGAKGISVFSAFHLNRIQAELIALSQLVTGATSFLHGLTIEASTGAEVPLTLLLHDELTDFASSKEKFISFKRETGGVTSEVGSIVYDYANDQMEFHNFDVDIATGVFQVGGTTIFENDRDLAIHLIPAANNTYNLGSSSRRFFDFFYGGSLNHDLGVIFEADRDLAMTLTPNATATLDLGSTTRYFRNLYARDHGEGAVLDLASWATPAIQLVDVATTAGVATITSASASFAAGDVGKLIVFDQAGGGGSDSSFVTTIASYISPTSVTVTLAPTLTRANVRVIYGTDQTANINTAIATVKTYGGRLRFPNGAYLCASTIDASDAANLILEGPGGNADGQDAKTEIVYTGTAAGRFLDLRSSAGATVRSLAFTAAAEGWTGRLVDLSHSGTGGDAVMCVIEKCKIGGLGDRSPSSIGVGIYLNQAICTTVRNCYITLAAYGIHGYDGNYSNAINIENNIFRNIVTAPIYNPYQGWNIKGNTFENSRDGAARGIAMQAGVYAEGCDISGNWFGDSSVGNGTWISLRAKGAKIEANHIESCAIGVQLLESCDAVTVKDNYFVKSGGFPAMVGISLGNAPGTKHNGIEVGPNFFHANVDTPFSSTSTFTPTAELMRLMGRVYVGEDTDTYFEESAAGVFNLVGAFSIGGTTLFEGDRDLAEHLIPRANNTLNLGSAARQFYDLFLGNTATIEGTVALRRLAASHVGPGTGVQWTLESAAASGGDTLKDAPDLTLRSHYWTGAADATRDAVWRHNITATTPASQMELVIGGNVVAIVTDAGALDIDGAFSIGGTTLFEADRDLAEHLIPRANNTLNLGSAARQFYDLFLGGSITWENDTTIGRGAANRFDVATGDSFNIVLGNFQMAGTTMFESDRDVAIVLTPNADNTLAFGTTARRWSDLIATQHSVYAAASDVNPTWRASSTGLSFGAGGASALDSLIKRSGAAAFQLRDAADAAYASLDALSLSVGGTEVFQSDRDLAIHLIPSSNNSLNLGSAARRFFDVYYGGKLSHDSGDIFEADRDLAMHLIPNADNSLDLGSSTRKYRGLYLGATAPTAANTGQVGYANGGLEVADGTNVWRIMQARQVDPTEVTISDNTARTPSTDRPVGVTIIADVNTMAVATEYSFQITVGALVEAFLPRIRNFDAVSARRMTQVIYAGIIPPNTAYKVAASSTTNLGYRAIEQVL